jgi:hypothetical protein
MAKKTSTPEQEKPKVDPKLVITTTPVIINESLGLNSEKVTNNPIKDELVNSIIHYSNELIMELNNVYIGGIAAQKRDQLFEVLSKFKNLN